MATLIAQDGSAIEKLIVSFQKASDSYPDGTTEFTVEGGGKIYASLKAVSANAIEQLIANVQGTDEERKAKTDMLEELLALRTSDAPKVLAAQSQIMVGAAGAVAGLGLESAAVKETPKEEEPKT